MNHQPIIGQWDADEPEKENKQRTMNYFIDTEFLEGTQKTWWGGQTKPTIDLISIGIVSEDGREYYAISKDFNLKEAWNRYQRKQVSGDARNQYPEGIKEYWIRENVLQPIWEEWFFKMPLNELRPASYSAFKKYLEKYGRTNQQIAEDVKRFVYNDGFLLPNSHEKIYLENLGTNRTKAKINFYGYYADYDWVVFCWLFGKMMDLPKGFPMYCRDLKQALAEKGNPDILHLKTKGEHNALVDARFNQRLFEFLKL